MSSGVQASTGRSQPTAPRGTLTSGPCGARCRVTCSWRQDIWFPRSMATPRSLWSRHFPPSRYAQPDREREILVIPNLNDLPFFDDDPRLVSPCSAVESVIGSIAQANLVISSSLHGIVIAESYGVPARRLVSAVEPDLKYHDYYRGTGRPHHRAAESIEEAIALGGEDSPVWSPAPLLDAFPFDLWTS